MEKSNFMEEFTKLFESTPTEFGVAMGVILGFTAAIVFYTFLIIFIDAFTIYMGARMVQFEVKYGRCMILAALQQL